MIKKKVHTKGVWFCLILIMKKDKNIRIKQIKTDI